MKMVLLREVKHFHDVQHVARALDVRQTRARHDVVNTRATRD
jgi:hypothetical protein